MPLDFVESDKTKAPVEFFSANANTRPQHLEGEVLPDLIRRVGDAKSGRLSLWMVEQFLEKNVLIFDPEVLIELFKEADYKQEGSLDLRVLAAALSGRYPKRKLTKEWRDLVALLLGIPAGQLVLTEDFVDTKIAVNGVFNAESVWTTELPPIKPKRNRIKDANATADFQKPSSAPAAPTAASVTKVPLPPFYEGIRVPPPPSPPAMLLTTAGVKLGSTPPEHAINPMLQTGGEGPRITFQAAEAFSTFSQGQNITSQQGLDGATVSAMVSAFSNPSRHTNNSISSSGGGGSGAADASWAWSPAPRSGLRAWSATLPPTGITMTPSMLSTLRSSVQTSVRSKPAFSATHRTLSPCALDLKKTLGAPMEVSRTLGRVEPLRPTNMAFDAGYVQWGGYASTCRTAPTAWYNEHASVPAAARIPSKYPWGEWGVADR